MSVVERFSREAADQKVKILAFPEMCLTGYWHVRNLGRVKLEELAEPVPSGPSTRAVARLSSQYDMAVGVGLIERGDDGRLFNTYVVCLPDGQFHRHRKLHAFESDDIASGDSYTVFDTSWGVKVGVLICWDNNLVENARATALLGADIVMAPGSSSRSCAGHRPRPPSRGPGRWSAVCAHRRAPWPSLP